MLITKLKYHLEKIRALSDQGIVSASNFAIGVLCAKIIGLEAFGIFSLCWLIILFVSGIHTAAIITPQATIAGKTNPGDESNYLKEVLGIHALFVLISTTIVSVLVFYSNFIFKESDLSALVWPTAFCCAAFITHDYFRKRFYVLKKSQHSFLMTIIAYGCQFSIMTYSHLENTLNLQVVLIAMACSFLLSSVVAMFISGNLAIPSWSLKATLIRHWNFSKWLTGTALLQWLSGNYFLIAAGSIFGPSGLGVIRLVQTVHGVLNVLFLTIENYIPVRAAAIYQTNGQASLSKYLRLVAMLGLVLTLIICLGLAVGSPFLAAWLSENVNLEFSSLVKLYTIVSAMVFLGYPLRINLRTIERTKHIFFGYLFSIVFSLSCANWMVGNWGLAGVCYGLAITQLIMNGWILCMIYNYQRNEHYSYRLRKG